MIRPGLRSVLLTCVLAAMLVAAVPRIGDAGVTPLTTRRLATGFNKPLFVVAPPGDSQRLFVVEQRGVIRIVDLLTLTVLSTPFLNIDGLIAGPVNSFDERGLLGLAFHPDYADNGFFYVNYTNNASNSVVARYRVSTDPNVADPNSAMTILTVNQPFENHNGGMLAFGPDGYLYIGFGDGGAANDPGNRAQNGLQRLGKMLRIDVDGGTPFAVPPDNPFVGDPSHLDEIWAVGLRNPWRYSFDRATGDLYIADVGQDAREEIDFQPAGSSGGENYGWRCMEGASCTGLSGCTCNSPALTPPIYNFSHGGGNCSVTGGYVYRGAAMPGMHGIYFFADYCSDQIWSFRYVGSSISEFTTRTSELAPGGGLFISNIPSFGEDALGEIYIIDRGTTSTNGEVFKIVPAAIDSLDCNANLIVDSVEVEVGLAPDCNLNGVPDGCDITNGTSTDVNGNDIPDECEFPALVRGDCNVDGLFDIADPVGALALLFDPLVVSVPCEDSCDGNDDGAIDLADPIYMLGAQFGTGPNPPSPFPGCGLDLTLEDLGCDSFPPCP